MDPIKKVMDEAYKEGRFSDRRKSLTLEIIQKKKRSMNPIPIVTTLFVSIFILFMSTMMLPSEEVEYVSTVSESMDIKKIYMERILEGFNIATETELEQYLSESDWLLQLALESENGEFYNSTKHNKWEREDLAALLHGLYNWRQTNGIKKLPFEPVNTFHEVTREAPFYIKVLSDTFEDNVYLTSTEEKLNIPTTYFGSMSQRNQIGLICTIIFFALLFLWNIKRKVNMLFRLVPIAIILMCIVPIVAPVENGYAYDEASLMKVAQKRIEFEGGVLEDAATFGDGRFGLITVNDTHYMVTFKKDEHGYRYSSMESRSSFVVLDYFEIGDKETIMIAGFFEGHPYSKVKFVGDRGQVIEVPVNPGESVIKKVTMPKDSYRYHYYDEDGNEIE